MRSYYSALVATLASSLLLATSTLAQVSLTPALNASQAGTLSVLINPSYAGFGIEPTDLFVYTGASSTPNQLTYNLLSNLANYTGAPPHIRVGGNAGDTMLYSSSVNGYQFQTNPNPTGQGFSRPTDYFFFGPDYYRALNNFPAGTPITYGLNLAYTGGDALQRIVEQAQALFQYVGNSSNTVKIAGLEIGNEPDLYITLGYRESNWTVFDFGGQWVQRAQVVYDQVLKPLQIGSNFFEVAATATTAARPYGQPFRISNLVNTGVASQNGIFVAGWNQHDYYFYVGVSGGTVTIDSLLQLQITTGQFTEWYNQVQQAIVTGKPYYLREMGSIGPNGMQGVSDTFANALWTFFFFFYAASIQVASVQMHMTQFSYAAPWQTNNFNNQPPHVRPTYYAWAAWAQIIGASCDTRIASIQLNSVPGNYDNRLAAFAAYRSGGLASVTMINTQPYYANQGQPGYQNFNLALPGLAGKTLYMSVLYADGADSTSNILWNGISYEQSGTGQPSTVNGSQWTMTVGSDGSLSVPVRDSQVVVASTFRLGRETVNQQNCNKLAEEAPGTGTAGGANAAPTFKATKGFLSSFHLSMTAIIAIAAGGGVFLIALLGLFIWCCVRASKKSSARKARASAILKAPPRHDDHPLLERDYTDDSQHSFAYKNSPGLRGWESPMTSVSHDQQVQPSQSYHNLQPEYDYAPANYQYHPQHPQVMHSPTPQQT